DKPTSIRLHNVVTANLYQKSVFLLLFGLPKINGLFSKILKFLKIARNSELFFKEILHSKF
ncbi:hypothetical protein BEN43_12095, partial [Leptospira interrogans serovar Bataviae]|nr:hypothetical protein [Leptospira interrogans serovar Bataviae]